MQLISFNYFSCENKMSLKGDDFRKSMLRNAKKSKRWLQQMWLDLTPIQGLSINLVETVVCFQKLILKKIHVKEKLHCTLDYVPKLSSTTFPEWESILALTKQGHVILRTSMTFWAWMLLLVSDCEYRPSEIDPKVDSWSCTTRNDLCDFEDDKYKLCRSISTYPRAIIMVPAI